MPRIYTRIVTASLIASLCLGCSDRDRELARRTGDGSDTFKYKAPDDTKPGTSAPERNPHANDGSDTFHYKRDPRTFPKQPSTQGK